MINVLASIAAYSGVYPGPDKGKTIKLIFATSPFPETIFHADTLF
jgi:hypothetical protein